MELGDWHLHFARENVGRPAFLRTYVEFVAFILKDPRPHRQGRQEA